MPATILGWESGVDGIAQSYLVSGTIDDLPLPVGLLDTESPPVGDSLADVAIAFMKTRIPDVEIFMTDETLTTEVEFIDIYVRRLYPCIDEYEQLVGDDKVLYERAIGLILASIIRPSIPYTTAVGPLTEITIGPDTFVYAKPVTSKKTLEELWMDQAIQALNLIECVAAAQATGSTVFALASRRRTARRVLYGSSDITAENPLYELWTDARQRYEFIGE